MSQYTDFGFAPSGAHVKNGSISGATTLTPATGATKILIQAVTQNVRYRLDGTNPDATTGFQLKAGDPPIVIPIVASQTIRVIEETATAVINYQWGT